VENVLPHRKMPIRCFEGNAKPYEPFWTWRNAADGEDGEAPEMELYGYISEYSWSEDDITPAMFRDDLNAHGKGGPVTIRMNSYGGDVIAASVMSSIIKGYAGKVTVQIDGIAASAATVVAIAGEQVRMQEGAYFMIHDPMVAFFLAVLNIEDLSTMVDQLKVVKDGIINAYESKTGLSRPRLAKMMVEETWMDAKTAQNLGFADEVITSGKKKKAAEPAVVQTVAMINALNALKCYQHVPEALKNALNPPVVSDPRNAGGEAGSRGHAAGDPEAGRDQDQQLRDYLEIFGKGE
jgi:ATP-dependent protease ClpP protease subunit